LRAALERRGPLKLAIVIGSLARGGAEGQIVELVRSAHPAQAECVVICVTAEEGSLASDIRATGATLYTLGFEGVRSWNSLRAVPRLFRILREVRPDAVYAFMFWSYVVAFPVAAVSVPRAARVAGLRTSPALDGPGQPKLLPLRRLAARLADAAIANSDDLMVAWANESPRLARKLHLVRNGVRTFTEDGPAQKGRSPFIVCIANLNPYKGHKTLLEALSRLPAELEWTLLLAGEGPERGRISQQARELGLDDRVRLLGLVEDIDGLLERADVAVLASYTEGLPNAVLEAMAHAVPVVATDVGGVRELLGTGAGILVPPGNPEALAEALHTFLEDADLRGQAGSIGRREVELHFGIETMRDRTLAVIDAAVQAAAGRRPAVQTRRVP
jgi:glycosyltransferase involved in cell wall biosynthesis